MSLATAGSLDGWRDLKVLPVPWFDGPARILFKVEETGVWQEGLLDSYIAMIPKTDSDATPSSECSCGVFSKNGAAKGLVFLSWVPDSVFSAGGGRSSVEAWYTTALDIEELV